MYEREKIISLPVSTSALPNNLSTLFTGDQVFGAVIHREEVNLVSITNHNAKPVTLRPSMRGQPFAVTQVRWVRNAAGRHVLVITGEGGVILYDWDGGVLLKVVELKSDYVEEIVTRGIAGLSGSIAVGCNSGEVIIVSSGQDNSYFAYGNEDDFEDITHGTELGRFRWTTHAISAIASNDNILAVADKRGNVSLGQIIGGQLDKFWDIESYGSAVSSMVAGNSYLFTGFISGHIRVYDMRAKTILAEICGHARAVSGMDAIDGVEEGEALRAVSVGEDTFVRVWSVGQKDITSRKGDKKEVKHIHSKCLENQLLTGVAFTDEKGNGFMATAYDVPELTLYLSD